MYSKKRIVANTILLYLKTGITTVISLYSTRLILEGLGVEDFGIFNIVCGSVALLGFLSATLTTVSQRFVSLSEGEGDLLQRRITFNTSFSLHFMLALLMIIILSAGGCILFRYFLNIPNDRILSAKWAYATLVIGALFSIMRSPYNASTAAHEDMLFFSIIDIIDSIFKLVSAIILIYFHGDRLILYAVLYILITVFNFVTSAIYCEKRYEECHLSIRRYFSYSLFKSMIKFAGLTLINVSGSMISQYGLRVTLNNFFGPIANAANGIAVQVGGQISTVSSNIQRAITPVIVKLRGANEDLAMSNLAIAGCKYSYILMATFSLPIAFEASSVCQFWLGTVPKWSVIFIQLEIIRLLIEQLSSSYFDAILATGRIKRFHIVVALIRMITLFMVILFLCKNADLHNYYTFIIIGSTIYSFWLVYYASAVCNIKIADYLKNVIFPAITITSFISIVLLLIRTYIEESYYRCLLSIISSVVISGLMLSILAGKSWRKHILDYCNFVSK